jgi:exonuclease III
VIDDLNIAISEFDRTSRRADTDVTAFFEFMSLLGLIDVWCARHPHDVAFTYHRIDDDARITNHTSSRLDHVLAHHDIAPRTQHCEIWHPDPMISEDHCAIDVVFHSHTIT